MINEIMRQLDRADNACNLTCSTSSAILNSDLCPEQTRNLWFMVLIEFRKELENL